MTETADDHVHFVTLEYFMVEMLGFKSKQSYYDHASKPGWPQRVYPGGKPMLVLEECRAYQRRLMDSRAPEQQPAVPGPKRRPGRPVQPASP
jgi:hypothetical protein